ncbi:23S rRNA (uracil(1939)-C(5))-methyltransferase RlmD [Thalassotalea aquiviva]|uniref:23S rRNA (uracil(1939)-C(5))-methyltransferase RlmD n=1 Tax=Thalassotalea aquiviva TaxID=3242415 RepID=UPI00352A0C2C
MAKIFKPKAKNNSLNQILTIDIQRLDINGDGVGRWQQKPVFVAGALPNETVKAKIIEQKSKFLRAKTSEVITPSEDRVSPECRHYFQCGGCDLQHMSIAKQRAFKQQKVEELFARNAQITALPWQPQLNSSPWHYRRKARIGVQYNKLNQAIVGFRQKNTAHLTSIKSCPILTPEFEHQFSALATLINQLSTHRPISHVEVIHADKPKMILRVVKPLSQADLAKIEAYGDNKSFDLCIDSQGMFGFPDISQQLLSYQIDGLRLQFSSSDFVQVNASLNEQMVSQAIAWLELSSDDSVLDLFCGLGNFSLPIARRVARVVGVEGVDAMVARASANAKANGLNNTEFFQADLNADTPSWPWFDDTFSKVLLDPARAGALNAVKNIADSKIKTILYVSCDPATMSRDAKQLLESGFSLDKIALMDMFVHTRHVETMALFRR